MQKHELHVQLGEVEPVSCRGPSMRAESMFRANTMARTMDKIIHTQVAEDASCLRSRPTATAARLMPFPVDSSIVRLRWM